MEHCFHMCDRVVIYVFIAASYAPWSVPAHTHTHPHTVVAPPPHVASPSVRLNLRELGPVACHMRWLVWLMAAGGMFYVFNYHEK